MRLIRVLAAIAVVSAVCGLALYLTGISVARLPGPRAVGAEVGRALFFLLAGGILASMVFWFRRNNHLVNYPGLGTGICAALLLALFNWIGSPQGQRAILGGTATSETWSVYAPQGCGYEIRFPKKPDVSRKQHYHSGKWFELERAEYDDRDGYLRAECLMFHLTPPLAQAMVKGFVQNEGLQTASVAEVSPSVIEAKGTKTVGNEKVMVVSRVHHGRTATFTLLATTAPSQYPTRQINAFFASVKGIRDQDRPFLMSVIFENHGQQQVPISEEACLTWMAQVRDTGPQQMAVTAIGQAGKLTEISGVAQRVHCIAPDGKIIGPQNAK